MCGGQVQLMQRTRHNATLQPHPLIHLAVEGKALRLATQLQLPSLSFLWDHQVQFIVHLCFTSLHSLSNHVH